ncbi:MAG TPA: hypothetical protein VFU46_09160 [Gemmatimonadales bacterium]|nr:hypothetical protein [Gemmatimonadales bacterium]
MRAHRAPVLTGRGAGAIALAGLLLLAVLVGIAWRATSALWFLVFPVLLLGLLAAAGMAVLWILRHF